MAFYFDPGACTASKVRQLTRCVSRHFDAELSAVGIKTTQYALLTQMLLMECPRPGDLAVSMRMTASTLTRNLRPLRAAGWITVGPGKDNRSRCVCITQNGRLKQQEASGQWRIAQTRLDERLGSERVQALHTLIDEVLVRI